MAKKSFEQVKNEHLKTLEQYALDLPEIKNESGRVEELRAIINQYILTAF